MFLATATAQAGSLDPAFGGTGVVTLPALGQFRAVAVQPDGKLVAVGSESVASNQNRWLVHRCLPDGGPDLSFGIGGTVTLFAPAATCRAEGVAIDAAGRLVVVGSAIHGSGNSAHADFAVVRLLGGDGSLDPGFGAGGVRFVHAGAKTGSASEPWAGVVLQPDGRIVVGGWAGGTKSIDLALARLTTAGALDTSFGSSGVVRDALSTSDDLPWYGALAVQSGGKLLLGAAKGNSSSATESWYVMRYQANGALDSTWGAGGRVRSTFPGFSYARVERLLVDPSGTVIATGRARNDAGTSYYDCCIARYLANGALDISFGNAGFANSGLAGDDQGHGGVARQADGSLVVGAGLIGGGAAVRFGANGELDIAFGSGGMSATVPNLFPQASALDAAGNIVMVGATNGIPALVRMLVN